MRILFRHFVLAGCCLGSMAWLAVGALLQTAQAQIQPDNTLEPTPTTLRNEASTGQLLIEGGASRGSTLFHSFSDFNISPNGNVYFVNPDSIELIVSRVTGNRASNLLGTLGILGEADLFFVNPNGIVFGTESKLDVNGSFVASTAESVVFNDEFIFGTAAPEAPSLLTVSTPTGLQFGQRPGTIGFQSPGGFRIEGLVVQPGQTLALLGGELDFQGAGLNAFGGRIELGSVAEADTVNVISLNPGFTFNYDNISIFNNLNSTRSLVDTTILDNNLTLSDTQNNGVFIQAADIVLSSSTLVLAGTITDLPGGDIFINARQLALEGGSSISSSTISNSQEDIVGDAGDIVINASESVTLSGGLDVGFFSSPTNINAATLGPSINFFNGSLLGNSFGDGGNITINAKQLSVTAGSSITASSGSAGDAGDITIDTSGPVEISGIFTGESSFRFADINTNTTGTGESGNILINSAQLLLQDAGAVTSRTAGLNAGGIIEVNANRVEVIGSAVIPAFENSEPREIASAVTAVTSAEGQAGQIRLNAEQIIVLNGGQVTTATAPGSRGDGNLLQVNAAEEIRIAGVSAVEGSPSGLFSSTNGSGNANEVRVDTKKLSILRGGEISAATLSESAESSGSLNLNVDRLFLDNGSLTVETRAQGGSGAKISISGLDIVLLRNGSLISAEAVNSANGGNVLIDAAQGFVVAPFEEDSDILARANVGDGGNIEIVAQSILGLTARLAIRGNGTNDIDASSSFGSSGTVLLNELAVNPAVEETELPDNTGVPKIAQQCNPNQEISSFVVTGRGGVPLDPQATVPEILWQPNNSNVQSASSAVATDQVVEAQGWQVDAVGQVVLTASATETVPYGTTSSVAHCSRTHRREAL
ncbi:filamentous hemagglutinin N-terminal domain-containing protein [Leptolyngbya cf. ectocarpi LEGE 11479]|uniref:Filamentous hemagglutinin N-terminal domain-containing protein n=1 Tax=Leptolyngbya cf. ectocarpi LEGE 11479 TaxID=1828722 RepID=A0A928ZUZ1_LEPEC|nr:filamentous hemagglutinin N-terminal domain-containing protein [Leptolyngbya ectocarpi]MBE9067934.1 filamentous hemagglutinin N-terminal domain-containing protein [Leptolyngbya cf. ectocarpi LEGE 11479]